MSDEEIYKLLCKKANLRAELLELTEDTEIAERIQEIMRDIEAIDKMLGF
jgi:hypothetical protein